MHTPPREAPPGLEMTLAQYSTVWHYVPAGGGITLCGRRERKRRGRAPEPTTCPVCKWEAGRQLRAG